MNNRKDTLDEIYLKFEKTGTTIPKRYKPAHWAVTLGRNLRLRFVHYCLRRLPVSLLDNHIAMRIGKPLSKSAQIRKEAKAYNQGAQDMISRLRKDGYWV